MSLGIDHVIISCVSPDAAVAELCGALGLRPGGGGRHDAVGTFNRLIWLGDSFVELVGVFDRELAEQGLFGRHVVQLLGGADQAFAGLALATDDLARDVELLRGQGSVIGDPLDGDRIRPDGRVVRWRTGRLPEADPDLGLAFLIEHDLSAAEWTAAERSQRTAEVQPMGTPVRLLRVEVPVASTARATQRLHKDLGLAFRPSLVGGGARATRRSGVRSFASSHRCRARFRRSSSAVAPCPARKRYWAAAGWWNRRKPQITGSGHACGVDDQRVGAAIRAVRVRRGWRQSDLAATARVSASTVSLIERGHLTRVSVAAFRRVSATLEIRAEVTLRLPHGELDRLLNAGHAALHEAIARYLDQLPGWVHAPEVSFAFYAERGVIDILAFHEPTGALLVIELKTEFVSLEDLLTSMDIRMRHASTIARERGWRAKSVSAWVVFAESRTTRRRTQNHAAALRSAFPADGRTVKGWLSKPSGQLRAVSFWTDSNVAAARRNAAAPRRVRKRGAAATAGQIAA